MSELKLVMDALGIPNRPALAEYHNAVYVWRLTSPWHELTQKEAYEPCELGTVYCLESKSNKGGYILIHATDTSETKHFFKHKKIHRFETACEVIAFAINNQNIDESMAEAFCSVGSIARD